MTNQPPSVRLQQLIDAGAVTDTPEDRAADLSLQAVNTVPVDVDSWANLLNNEEETADFWEAFTYEVREDDDDEREFILIANRSTVIAVVIDGTPYEDWLDYERQVIDPHFEETGEIPEGAVTEELFDELKEVEPYMYGSEGPMMNYWYPIHEQSGGGMFTRSFDPIAAALKIEGEPLCIVEVDGEYGLALTGGGMDLTWQICRAFVLLGMCPPAHFAALPNYAEEWGERHEIVYHAMRRTLQVRAERAEQALARLGELKSRMTNRIN